jgi:hypothetical protein
MTTETEAPHPAAAQAKAALDALAAALAALDTATSFGPPGPGSLAKANGLLLALTAHDRFTDPATDYPTRAATAAATLATRLQSAAGDFRSVARRIELERLRAARAGDRDPLLPVLLRGDFTDLREVVNPRSRLALLVGVWAGLPEDHPARPYFSTAALPSPAGCGPCLVLGSHPDAAGPFEVADVRRLTKVFAEDLAEVRRQAGREAEQARRAERERLERDPQWQIDQLRRQVADLQTANAVSPAAGGT